MVWLAWVIAVIVSGMFFSLAYYRWSKRPLHPNKSDEINEHRKD